MQTFCAKPVKYVTLHRVCITKESAWSTGTPVMCYCCRTSVGSVGQACAKFEV